jgi:hypothetical protein
LYNKFLALLPGIALNCIFKVFLFILSYFVYAPLKKNKIIICFSKVFAEFSFVLLQGDRSTSAIECPLPDNNTEAAVHCRI